jgi:PilZ domain
MLPQELVEETSISLSPLAPQRPERRHQQRHLTILRVGALMFDGKRELCLVRNISAGGVMVHVYSDIAIGTRVTVEIKNDEPIAGIVVWESDSNIGIEFDHKIDVPELLATSKLLGDGRRARRPRVCVSRPAKVRSAGVDHQVEVIDVSQGGVKVATSEPLPVEADVVVTLEGMAPLAGIVRWQHGRNCGISFLQVIPIQQLCDWLRSGE